MSTRGLNGEPTPARDLEVVVLPGDMIATFDHDDTPMLQFGWWGCGRTLQEGWVLFYMDSSDGVEDYFVGGNLGDIDWAIESARRWLRLRSGGLSHG